jgi:hypothetical protein
VRRLHAAHPAGPRAPADRAAGSRIREVVVVIWLAVFGLICGLVGCGIGLVQMARRRPYAPVLMLAGLPGLIGGIYHTWRLWP